MLNYIIFTIKRIIRYITKEKSFSGTYAYRKYLFEDLKKTFGEKYFENKRVLEIGPKDGEDTERILTLNPKEIVLFDLPDKLKDIDEWKKILRDQDSVIIENFLYQKKEAYEALENFDLIYFTGVLYHNPEQLRFINRLYDKLNDDGVLVLETATIRNIYLRKKNLIQVWYPETYRGTTTISHLPSKTAVLSWLRMVGFRNIIESDCYIKENYDVKSVRFACFSQKNKNDIQETYYKKQIEDSNYLIGGSN